MQLIGLGLFDGSKPMRKKLTLLFLIYFLLSCSFLHAMKLKDLASINGIRDNQLIGYGLVVGLNGTGDRSGTEFTIHSLVNMLDRMGITVDENNVRVDNVAAVMVTAKLSPFARSGSKMDVVVSSIGDANSLEGGTLLLTPMSAPNGEVYAVAQGPVSVGGRNVAARGTRIIDNHPTVGRIPNGAMVEKEITFGLHQNDIIELAFSELSISNIVRAKNVINDFFKEQVAYISSPSTISIKPSVNYINSFYEFMNAVLQLEIQPEASSRVVVDERTGTVVVGSDVRVSTVAISHGDLTIKITSTTAVVQPPPFTSGGTAIVGGQDIEVVEEDSKLMVLPEGVMISDLVKALNALGATPRDLIAILQSIKAAGALQGELEVI